MSLDSAQQHSNDKMPLRENVADKSLPASFRATSG